MHTGNDPNTHALRSLADTDPAVREALDGEARRQRTQIELIASENVMSRAVREALGHEMGNKTLEGYPGNRFHGGGEYVDVVERLAIERAQALFGAAYANVQPHSGTQANQAVFFVLLRPGDRILSLDLAAGGHLSHGAGANLSGRWFDSHHYGVDRSSGLLDYDDIEARAREVRPVLLIAGGSAYPRAIDFERMARIAHAVEARLLVDMAHIAGLVGAGAHASPLPHADIVTCTTTKTLRGPRGGLILARSDAFARRLQSAVFPGVQGSLQSNVLAAKAVCLGEALRPEFKDYGRRVTKVPEEHDGANPFTLRLRLSEDVATRARTLREESFTVTNGAVERARRIGSGRNLWELAIRPATDAEVVVEVPLREACDVAGAICTADGRWLSHAITHAIPGPLSVSVADAGAEEGLDQGLRFVVTLSRAVDRAVSVDYETEDGTAHAGSDYEASTGTVEFGPGETEAVVVVAVLDDAVDEGEETFTFVLTSASGARIGDARATGTIENSDHLQEQWLTRFGRTVASQVVDTIGDRLQSSRGSHVTIAGHGFGPGNAKDGDDTHWSDIEKDKGLDTLSERELGLGSSFQLSSRADNGPGAVWTTWGRLATSGFASNDDELALDGDVTSALLGFDAESGSWLAGAAVAHSRGDGTYRHSSDVDTNRDRGKVRSTLTSIHPYARVRTDGDVSLWAIAGYGTGTLTLPGWCAEGRADAKTSLDMRMAAAGVRGTVLAGASPSDLEIGVHSDVTWSQTRSERATSVECGNVESARADTTRTRLVMDGARTWELKAGRTLTPSVEIGLRHDGGDAETGLGLEAGARLRYRDAATGLLLEGGVRGLIAHEASGYEEWGASASVVLEPDGNGRGLSLRVAPSWGAASSSVERLWSGDDTARLGQSPEYDDAAALQAELGTGCGHRSGGAW